MTDADDLVVGAEENLRTDRGPDMRPRRVMVMAFVAIGGVTIILLFGLLMFMASLGPARPF